MTSVPSSTAWRTSERTSKQPVRFRSGRGAGRCRRERPAGPARKMHRAPQLEPPSGGSILASPPSPGPRWARQSGSRVLGRGCASAARDRNAPRSLTCRRAPRPLGIRSIASWSASGGPMKRMAKCISERRRSTTSQVVSSRMSTPVRRAKSVGRCRGSHVSAKVCDTCQGDFAANRRARRETARRRKGWRTPASAGRPSLAPRRQETSPLGPRWNNGRSSRFSSARTCEPTAGRRYPQLSRCGGY